MDPVRGDSIKVLSGLLRGFAADRDWQQFHTPRSLVLALVGEVGELAAELQWLSDASLAAGLDSNKKSSVAAELADILSYLLRLADVLEVNVGDEVVKKLELNEARYPADLAKGSSAKYTAYE